MLKFRRNNSIAILFILSLVKACFWCVVSYGWELFKDPYATLSPTEKRLISLAYQKNASDSVHYSSKQEQEREQTVLWFQCKL